MDLKTLKTKLLNSDLLNALERAELEAFDCDAFSETALHKLREERAALQGEVEGLRRRQVMEKLCAKLHCTDPDYLEYRIRQSSIDPGDEAAVRKFAEELAADSPGCFQAHIVPGSSAGTPPELPPGAGDAEALSGDRIGMLAASIGEAPDAR